MKNYSNKKKYIRTVLISAATILLCTVVSFAQPLTANAGADQTICFGSAVSIGGAPTASFGGGGYVYTWSPSSGLSSTTVANPVANPTVTTTYTVTVNDALAGTATAAVTISVNPIPVLTATPSTQAICSGTPGSVAWTSDIAGTTFSWTSFQSGVSGATASGTGSSVSDTLYATFGMPGYATYTVLGTVSGCTSAPIYPNVDVNPMPSPLFSYGSPACQNTGTMNPNIPGTAGVFTAVPAGLVFVSPTTGEVDLNASIPGTYSITNTVAAAGGCPTQSANTGYTISPFLDPAINTVSPVCVTDAAFNLTAASAGGIWIGTGITNAFAGTFDPAVAGGGSFNVTYTSAGPCSYTDTTIVTVVNTGDLYGQVTYSGGPLIAGTNQAVLFNYASTTTFDTVQVSTLDASGYFHFTGVTTAAPYLIKVFADTLLYPLTVPTYYGDEFLWDSASVKYPLCYTDTANIIMVEGVTSVGPGMLSGHVSEGAGFVRAPGDPVPGIDVKLGRNPGGHMMTNTQTNGSGNYGFNNIPVNTPGEWYTVYVDIPGLERDSVYNITITATNTTFNTLDYIADSNSVYPIYPTSVSVANAHANDVNMNVYPNPSNAATTVAYTLKTDANVQLDVYDVLGKKVESVLNANQQSGNYKANIHKLKAGIYFVILNVNNRSNTTRLVVID